MRPHTRLALFAFLVLPCVARAADGVEETWDRMHMAGAPAGYVHTVVKRTAGEQPAVECTVESRLSMKRMGQTTEIETTTRSWETPEGALLRIEATSKMSAQESRTVCVFSGAKVSLETTLMGKTRTVEKDVPAGLVGPVRAAELSKALAGTTGRTVECATFMVELQSAVRSTSTSKGAETVKLLDGASVSLTRVETAMTLATAAKPMPMSPVSWLDAKGEPIRTELKVSGIVIETFRVADEAAAKAEGASKDPAPDLFGETLLREDGLIPVARRVTAATIEVKPRGKGVTMPEFADAGHEVKPGDDGSLTIRATRRVPAAGKEGTRPLAQPPAALADFTGSSTMIQADAPEIAAVAKEVAGAETNAWKAAQALERWVFESVTKKNMNVTFASALEVCRSREGDCTEHAVLLAAVCRAAGIPARVVMGIEYLYGIWGGHAWDEVWIDGEWYPLDATNGFGFVDPLHLPMARMSMKEGGGAEFVELLGGLGNIDVDVIEVVRDGRRIAVDDPSLITTKDRVHTDRVLGISYAAPAGFEFDPPKRAGGVTTKTMELDGKTAAGRKAEIEIELMDAPSGFDWAQLFAQFGLDPASAKPFKVDGRDARRIERSRGGTGEIRVVADADGALWVFTLDRAEGGAEVAAFDAFLASVDFDVK
jgi:transglutaminase superfamily protein